MVVFILRSVFSFRSPIAECALNKNNYVAPNKNNDVALNNNNDVTFFVVTSLMYDVKNLFVLTINYMQFENRK